MSPTGRHPSRCLEVSTCRDAAAPLHFPRHAARPDARFPCGETVPGCSAVSRHVRVRPSRHQALGAALTSRSAGRPVPRSLPKGKSFRGGLLSRAQGAAGMMDITEPARTSSQLSPPRHSERKHAGVRNTGTPPSRPRGRGSGPDFRCRGRGGPQGTHDRDRADSPWVLVIVAGRDSLLTWSDLSRGRHLRRRVWRLRSPRSRCCSFRCPRPAFVGNSG